MNKLNLIKSYILKNDPINLHIFLTNKCNLNCKHCHYINNLNKKAKELNTEEYRKISKNLKNVEHISITGGEPFLRNDLGKIVNYFYINSKVRSIILQTNGYNTQKILNDVKKILSNNENLDLQVVISLDGHKDTHNKIRGNSESYKNATETIKQLNKINNKKLRVAINTVFSKENYKDILEFYKTVVYDLKPDAFFPLLDRCKSSYNRNFIKKWEELIKECNNDLINKKFIGYKRISLGLILNTRDIIARKNIINFIKGKNKLKVNCYAGKLFGMMYEDGEVVSCELKNFKLGNIKDFDYKLNLLWNSDLAKKSREEIINSKCECAHECFYHFNLLYNYIFLFKLFVNLLKRKII